MAEYEVIVIGAGNGGLTAAATLAREGVKVLLLERHNVPGGCATSFCRGRFEFEVALHQLSGMGTEANKGPLRGLFENLNVMDKIDYLEMKDLYRIIIPGSLDITLTPDRDETVKRLQDRFPAEKQNIADFFDLVFKYFSQVIGGFIFSDPEISRAKYPELFKYALRNTGDVMDQFFSDPDLKAAIAAYWTYQGIPPRALPFHDMAALLFVYMVYKPGHIRGGSQMLSNVLADTIINNGGEIRYNTEVKKILVEKGKALGVTTESGEEIRAKKIISNASKVGTFVDLMEEEEIPQKIRKQFRAATIGNSAFTVYLGLDCHHEDIGIHDSTNFLFTDNDMDAGFTMTNRVYGSQESMLLTCYNAIDPGFSPEGTSQIALVTLKYGEPWLKVPPEEYFDMKYKCAENMINRADSIFPGLKKSIEEMEVATPITHLRYLNNPQGAIYGFEATAKDSNFFLSTETFIENLYCAGSWAGMGGFQPTYDSGAATGRKVLKKLRG